ncbi:MAG: hypothetical protein ACQERD_06380 [Campylobacterota bacterium]
MKKSVYLFLFINIVFLLNANAARNLYLSYIDKPSLVYENQRFEVVIKALVTTSKFDNLEVSFENGTVQPLNFSSEWEEQSNNVFINSYIFKANTKDLRLPDFKILLKKEEEVVDSTVLEGFKIEVSDIAIGDEKFSDVIAQDLKLKAYKTKQYNNKESLTIIDLDATQSNLEDFNLKEIEEQGIYKLNRDKLKQNLVYYFVTPVHEKKVSFTYYSTKTKSLIDVTIPLILQNELVSTQTDLNPNDSSFEKYKKIAVGVLFLIFLTLYVIKRNKTLLFLTIILFIIAAIYLKPNSTGIIKKDSSVYILPTKNSTIFFKLKKNEKVEVLNSKKEFIKVMGVENKFIGWVKEDNFEKN